MSFRDELANYVEGQAEWRSTKAEEHPEDERNQRCSDGLYELERHIRALPEGDSRLLKAEREYSHPGINNVLMPGEETARTISRFRFNIPAESFDGLLQRLPGDLARDREQWEKENPSEARHTEDCVGEVEGDVCASVTGAWDQPGGMFVALSRNEFDELVDVPWCRIRLRAFELAEEEALEGQDR